MLRTQAIIRYLALSSLLLLAGCSAYSLKPAGTTQVGQMQFDTTLAWNKTPLRLGPQTETWTSDGLLLNRIIFVKGVESGKSIFRTVNKDTPMPVFDSKMLPHELEGLVQTSLNNLSGGQVAHDTSNLKPINIVGNTGVSFDFETFNNDGLLSRGRAVAVVVSEKLYTIIFSAASLHHYDTYIPEFDNIVSSLRI